MSIVKVDIEKLRVIAHDKRRSARAAEFAPWDEIIAKQIPGNSAQEAEAQRQAIRDKYAEIQADIDAATAPEQLKEIVDGLTG